MTDGMIERLFRTPASERAAGFDGQDGVEAFFYECGEYRGRTVKAFAWVGFPALAEGELCPGIVLVHGGGGTAFPDWVRLWNRRGYAAIALDTCGGVPCWSESPHCRPRWPRHGFSGPAGWGGFIDAALPPEEQWPYQAAAAVIAGHSLLRSFPQVDSARTGITGISWGGVLTCIAAGLDRRFAFAVPVYGCGFLDLSRFGEHEQVKDHPERCEQWSRLWDPSRYLRHAAMPFLWVNGTNDFAFPLGSTVRSAAVTRCAPHYAVRVRMVHGHGGAGEKPEEIRNFADLMTGHAPALALPEFAVPECGGGRAAVGFRVDGWTPARAELNYTLDSGEWKERLWQSVPAEIGAEHLSGALPDGATAWYFNLFNSGDGLAFSSEPQFRPV